ncbi:hypothetical protein K438DRAFT_1975781 [Mycena galopus ATCC 62051]|nr:hypothetical protein K438DRAFT_1975781 [Mycena galopus ATCC 62051]
MGRMRLPALSLERIEGAFAGREDGHPRQASPPPQTPDAVEPLVVAYLESEFSKLGSKNSRCVVLFFVLCFLPGEFCLDVATFVADGVQGCGRERKVAGPAFPAPRSARLPP